jgi:hypothetical protein
MCSESYARSFASGVVGEPKFRVRQPFDPQMTPCVAARLVCAWRLKRRRADALTRVFRLLALRVTR